MILFITRIAVFVISYLYKSKVIVIRIIIIIMIIIIIIIIRIVWNKEIMKNNIMIAKHSNNCIVAIL